MNMERLASAYKALLDKKDALVRKHKSELSQINEALEEIETTILSFMQENHLEKLSFDDVTFAIKEKLYANVEDWSSLFEFIQETGMFQLLKKGVKASEISEYLNETGDLPPGVKVERAITLSHRRK